MFDSLRSRSQSASGAILYVTIGALLMIWSILWYLFFLMPDANAPRWHTFACVGTILSGLAILVIGLLFGLIGHNAKAADAHLEPVASVPPQATTPTLIAPAAAAYPQGAIPPAVATGVPQGAMPAGVVQPTSAVPVGTVTVRPQERQQT